MIFSENIQQAFAAIRTNILRATLTMFIIAFGIMALVGVLTSIDGIKYWMASSFSTMGANTFNIVNLESQVRIGARNRKKVVYPVISYQQARLFKERMTNPAIVNIKTYGNFASKAKYSRFETNNNIQVIGTDINFLTVESYQIDEGRSLTQDDIDHARNVCIIGSEIKKKLFPYTSPINKEIYLDKHHYKVVGLFKEKGTSFGSPGDKVCMLPLTTVLKDYSIPNRSFEINVFSPDPRQVKPLLESATGIFRVIRKLPPHKPSNFAIVMSDSFVENLMENLKILTLSATAISIITLFGAGIGLMNIMLVSVTERTMEIGLRKALGATRTQILIQFLTEAITICQLGGLLGVAAGVGIGRLIAYLLDVDFVIPWIWIVLGFVICLIVGVISGVYPARKAARLDPIDALRYE